MCGPHAGAVPLPAACARNPAMTTLVALLAMADRLEHRRSNPRKPGRRQAIPLGRFQSGSWDLEFTSRRRRNVPVRWPHPLLADDVVRGGGILPSQLSQYEDG